MITNNPSDESDAASASVETAAGAVQSATSSGNPAGVRVPAMVEVGGQTAQLAGAMGGGEVAQTIQQVGNAAQAAVGTLSSGSAVGTVEGMANATGVVAGLAGAPVVQEIAGHVDTAIAAGSAVRNLRRNAPSSPALAQGDQGGLVAGGGPLPEVSFSISVEGWLPYRVQLTERLSGFYEATIELLSSGEDAQPRELLEQRATLTLARGPNPPQCTHGVLRAVRMLPGHAGQIRVEVKLVPELWELSQRTHYRIFQGVSALGIVREVLHDADQMYAGDQLEFIGDESLHPTRDYCVQYGETDLAFMTRLLEDEGLSFYFKQGEEHEILVIHDGARTDRYVQASIAGDSVLSISAQGAATSYAEHATDAVWEESLRPTSQQSRDFDFTRPQNLNQDLTQRKAVEGRTSRRRLHEYPGTFIFHGYDDSNRAYSSSSSTRAAEVRLQAEQADGARLQLTTNALGLRPGCRVSLSGHRLASLDQAYLVTAVTHEASNPQALHHDPNATSADETSRYENLVEAIPLSVVYRPPRVTPRPIVHGVQTAIVTADRDSAEEIHVDHHGRILVRFHWDQDDLRTEAQRSQRTSCWVRVSQPWAGGGMGAFTIPRVGMEVVVTFVDGNPDRPLVTGCVYNGGSRSSLDLPARKTHTSFRSESSPRTAGAGGYSELTFEDAAGSELLRLRAQHDMTTDVLNVQTNTIGSNRTTTVGASGASLDKLEVTGKIEIKATDEIQISAGNKLILFVDKSYVEILKNKVTASYNNTAKVCILENEIFVESSAGDVHVNGQKVYLNCK